MKPVAVIDSVRILIDRKSSNIIQFSISSHRYKVEQQLTINEYMHTLYK